MERKEFLKTSLGLGFGIFAGANFLKAKNTNDYLVPDELKPINGKYELLKLAYAYNALEPFIDAQTMEIHHTKHHQAYISKLNEGLSKEPAALQKSLEDLFLDLDKQSKELIPVLRNHGGGHWNHSFFWEQLKIGTSMGDNFKALAIKSFGSVEMFQNTFNKMALSIFGSGWCWVILQNNQLKIVNSPNQENPLMNAPKESQNKIKILFGIDVWEHAYYLKYQNKRTDYVSAFWNVLNWDVVEKRIN